MSALPGPFMAPPVSWFTTKRENPCHPVISPVGLKVGFRQEIKASAPLGKRFESSARDLPGVSGTPILPTGPVFKRSEEYVGRVMVQNLLNSLRVLREIPPDGLHGHFFPRKEPLIQHVTANALINSSIGSAVAHIKGPAVLEEESA